MKGFCEDVKERQTQAGKTYYIAVIDGKEMSFWDEKILQYKGKEVEYTTEQKGKYLNGKLGDEKKSFPGKPAWNAPDPRTMILAYAKDIVVAGMNRGLYDNIGEDVVNIEKAISDLRAIFQVMTTIIEKKEG